MEKFKELVFISSKYLKNADHMLYMTYPLVKDVKLLITISNNIDKAVKLSIMAFLRYDWLYKRIVKIPDDFDARLDLFKKISVNRYGFKLSDIDFAKEIDEIMVKHRQSPVEFIKNDKFVISYNTYKLKSIGYEDVKGYVLKAKPFILRLNNILRNDPLIASGRGRGN